MFQIEKCWTQGKVAMTSKNTVPVSLTERSTSDRTSATVVDLPVGRTSP